MRPGAIDDTILLELLQGLDVLVWLAESDLSRIVFVSDSAVRLLGFPLEAWQAPGFLLERMAAPEKEAVAAAREAVVAGHRGLPFAHRLVAQDGRERWFFSQLRLVPRSDAAPRIVGMMLDVTDRMQASVLLQEGERRTRLLLDQLPAMVFTTDTELRFTSAAGAALTRLGMKDGPVFQLSMFDLYQTRDPSHPSLVPFFRALAGESVDFEADWAGITYQTYVEPFRDPEGRTIGTIAVAHDVTDRKRLAAASEKSGAQLRTVLDHIVDLVTVCDTDGHVMMANRAAQHLLGSALGETPTIDLLVERFDVRDTEGRRVDPKEMPLARALRGEAVARADHLVRSPLSQRDLLLRTTAAPIHDERGAITGAVAVSQDVTDLAEFDRLKDQFVRVAAHELKTPVAIMKAYAQLLLRTPGGLPEAGQAGLLAIDRGASRIERIVNDLLTLSELPLAELDLALEPFDLADLAVREVARLAAATPSHRVRVEAPRPAWVQGARERIRQVVVSLIDNAVKFSPAGGEVVVTVGQKGEDGVLQVRDQGVGIPRDKQARIFERFYRAHTDTPHDSGGIGIGLHLARKIVAHQRGWIWFDSEPGSGSTFYLALPTVTRRETV